MTTHTEIPYGGWSRTHHLSNGLIELIATAEVGPRLIRLGFVGGPNLFAEFPAHMGQTGGAAWRIYGGHRLWHAPEALPRTYAPDNSPITAESLPGGLRLIQAVEASTGIQKEMDIFMAADAAEVRVVHRLRNHNQWGVELAPWALSVMAPGGTAVIPLPPRGSHADNLLPNTHLNLWAYTNMADPRWTWGEDVVLLRQDRAATRPQKLGLACSPGWAAYANHGQLFVVRFAHQPHALYPDGGSSAEFFTDAEMLEVETLGPLGQLAPGAAVEHTETWALFADVPAIQTMADVAAHVRPLVERVS